MCDDRLDQQRPHYFNRAGFGGGLQELRAEEAGPLQVRRSMVEELPPRQARTPRLGTSGESDFDDSIAAAAGEAITIRHESNPTGPARSSGADHVVRCYKGARANFSIDRARQRRNSHCRERASTLDNGVRVDPVSDAGPVIRVS